MLISMFVVRKEAEVSFKKQTTMFALFVSSMSCVKQYQFEKWKKRKKTVSVFVQTDLSTAVLNYYLLLFDDPV